MTEENDTPRSVQGLTDALDEGKRIAGQMDNPPTPEKIEESLRKEHVLNLEQRNPGIEEKYKIHLGDAYGVTIAGTNPMDSVSFRGTLTEIAIQERERGFQIRHVRLEDGLSQETFSGEKAHFNKEHLEGSEITEIGRLSNQDSFLRERNRIKGSCQDRSGGNSWY